MHLLDSFAAWLDESGAVAHAVITVTLAALSLVLGALALNRHNALLLMRKSERSFRDLYNNISEGVFRSTLDGRMIGTNPALVRLNGFDSEEEMLEQVNDIAGEWYVDPNRRAEIHQLLLENGKVTNLISEVYRYKTRERIWIEESTRLVRDKVTGRPLYYDGTVREVTDTVRRLELQERYDKITSMVSGCLYQLRIGADGAMSVPYVSSGVTAIYGIHPEEAKRDPSLLSKVVHPDDLSRVLASFKRSMETMTPRQQEYRVVTIDGVEKWVLGQSVPEAEPDGSTVWHGYFVDITQQKQAEARIHDLAYRDALTGLPNRAALVDGLNAALEVAEGNPNWSALFFIDLDQFKVLNDTKGHHFGDRLLCAVAERLTPIVGDHDLVARLGGDEFVIMMRDVGGDARAAEAQVERTAERIRDALCKRFDLEEFPFHTTASIGVALFRGRELTTDELLKRADMAMYEAKAIGRGGMVLFAPDMQHALEEELALTTDLRKALAGGDLELVYQPQVDDTGMWYGVEGLLRWKHATRGAIPPSVLIPLAERTGLGRQIDAFVLQTACRVLQRWGDDPGLRTLQLAVNVGNQRVDEGLVALVTDAVRSTGADPQRLTIELTERVMLDNVDEVDAALGKLKQLGVKVALDDFGTGYSSLSHLKRLPIDAIKIDRSFVSDLENDPNDRVIVQTILNIARNLGVEAVAEGVENEMQALLLRRFGCHAFQGFLYARPMALAEIEARVAAGNPRHGPAGISRLVV